MVSRAHVRQHVGAFRSEVASFQKPNPDIVNPSLNQNSILRSCIATLKRLSGNRHKLAACDSRLVGSSTLS